MNVFWRRRLRRSSYLVLHYDEENRLIVENFSTGARGGVHPLTIEVLQFFDDWRPAQAFRDAKSDLSPRLLQTLLTQLIERSLLVVRDRNGSGLRSRTAPWRPAASFFHAITKDVPFVDVETGRAFTRRRARETKRPPLFKHYPDRPQVRLPTQLPDSEFSRVVQTRRTWRQFGDGKVSLSDFAALLRLSLGVQRRVRALDEGLVALTTAPSGGARQPIEAYVVAMRVQSIPRGIYHYDRERNNLARLSAGVTAARIEKYLPHQWWYRGAGALILLTAVFPRVIWRYPYARAYRGVLIEAGHVCQTICLAATWLGLAPFCSMALADSTIERELGIDGVSESVIYAAGVGTRPAGATWAPWPRGGWRARPVP